MQAWIISASGIMLQAQILGRSGTLMTSQYWRCSRAHGTLCWGKEAFIASDAWYRLTTCSDWISAAGCLVSLGTRARLGLNFL